MERHDALAVACLQPDGAPAHGPRHRFGFEKLLQRLRELTGAPLNVTLGPGAGGARVPTKWDMRVEQSNTALERVKLNERAKLRAWLQGSEAGRAKAEEAAKVGEKRCDDSFLAHKGQDLSGSELGTVEMGAARSGGCCDECKARKLCTGFVVGSAGGQCYLKSGELSLRGAEGRTAYVSAYRFGE